MDFSWHSCVKGSLNLIVSSLLPPHCTRALSFEIQYMHARQRVRQEQVRQRNLELRRKLKMFKHSAESRMPGSLFACRV